MKEVGAGEPGRVGVETLMAIEGLFVRKLH